jgi:hypothetical protein
LNSNLGTRTQTQVDLGKRLLCIYFHEILLIAETSRLLYAYEAIKRSCKDNTRDK